MASIDPTVILVVVIVPLAVILGSVLLLSYAVRQYLETRTVATKSSLARLQEKMDVLESARYITTGTIVDVRAHAQRSKEWIFSGPAVEGIQVVIAIPTPTETYTTLWFKTPERLDGTSKFERFLAYCDVSTGELADLLGKTVPVSLTDGEWQTNWIASSRRAEPIVSLSQFVSHLLIGEDEEDVV